MTKKLFWSNASVYIKMYLVRILLIVLWIFPNVTEPQGILYPQGIIEKKIESKKIRPKDDLKHDNPDKQLYVAKLPKSAQTHSEEKDVLNNTLHNTSNKTVNTNINLTVNKTNLEEQNDDLTSGAITRGILVFMALSFLFILYVGIKTYRRKSRDDKRRTIVKKYGIRARRSDVEMEPLPLSDDDDDETVFDLTASRGNIK